MNRHSRERFYRELEAYLAFWTSVQELENEQLELVPA
jgi:hypothetical protein